MNRMLTIALALIAGLTGGLLTRYVAPTTAFAQAPVTNEIRAQSFTLVDQMDHAIGTFTIDPASISFGTGVLPGTNTAKDATKTRIILRDSNGREIWSAGSGIQLLNERIR